MKAIVRTAYGSTDVREQILGELEATREQFHRLLDSMSEADWSSGSRNPAWTNGQLVFHMAFGFMLIPPLFSLIRFWSRRSRRASRSFAAALDSATPLFHWVNARGPRGAARVFGPERLGRKYERVHAAILRKLDTVRDDEWDAGMYYPRRWDPTFGEFMTFAELFRYPVAHFRGHLRHLSRGRWE